MGDMEVGNLIMSPVYITLLQKPGILFCFGMAERLGTFW
jgi:hypothetical protein